jgi:hypothetical protein
MGQAHILCVREDALTLSKPSADLPAQVGAAVVRLCVNPEMHWTDSGLQPTTWADVGGHSNGIEHADEAHSTDRRLYIWEGNCLRPIHKVKDDDLKIAKELLQEELGRRGG